MGISTKFKLKPFFFTTPSTGKNYHALLLNNVFPELRRRRKTHEESDKCYIYISIYLFDDIWSYSISIRYTQVMCDSQWTEKIYNTHIHIPIILWIRDTLLFKECNIHLRVRQSKRPVEILYYFSGSLTLWASYLTKGTT